MSDRAYKIIGDSCLDLTEELKGDRHFQMIPLTLQVGETHVVDDETFDQKAFLELVKNSPECPKSACPSPEMFKEAYACDAEEIFVLTLSGNLSGTYQSAVIGKEMYEEEFGTGKKIAVIDSWSASAGELCQALLIRDLCEAGVSFEEIVERAEAFKSQEMHTYFVLETLDTLKKNGRLSGLQAFFATTLNIKPVMGADKGNIIKLDQARGINKGLARMCEIAVKEAKDPETKTVVIAHCNNEARAQQVKEMLLSAAPFKDAVITNTAGVATVYANDGGVVLAI